MKKADIASGTGAQSHYQCPAFLCVSNEDYIESPQGRQKGMKQECSCLTGEAGLFVCVCVCVCVCVFM